MDSATRKITLTATIVLFKNDVNVLKDTIDSFLAVPISKKLFLVDNSPTNSLEKKFDHPEIEYIFLNKNIGFGAAHNKVINRIKNESNYHLVLNPDVTFKPQVLPNLIEVLSENIEVAMIAPRVLYLNGEHQFTCRRFPSLIELIVRRLSIFKPSFKKIIFKGEYRDKDLTKSFYADYVSGCFQLYKTESFVAIEGFDERYFMYMEDVDICRKIIENKMKSLYHPKDIIIHRFEKGSSKNIKLFYYHIKSIFQYFYKWKFAK